MRFKITLILLFLNGVLGVFIFYMQGRKEAWQNEEGRYVLPPGFIDIVEKLEVKENRLDQFWVLKRISSKDWEIIQPIKWRANLNAITQVLTELQLLSWESKFPISELKETQSLKDYGLLNPIATLTLINDKEKIKLRIGEKTGVGQGRYLLSPDGLDVFIIADEIFEKISAELSLLQSQKIFDLPLYEINELAWENSAAKKVLLTKDEENKWEFELPINTPADKDKLEATLDQLVTMKVIQFIEPDPVSQGLDNPSLRLSLSTNNGRRQTLLVGKKVLSVNNATISPAEKGAGLYYAQLAENQASVFAIPIKTIDLLENAQVELRQRRFFSFNPEELTAVDISDKNRNVSLQKLETGDWKILLKDTQETLLTWPADLSIINEMVNVLNTLEAKNFVSDAPSEADIENFINRDLQRKVVVKTKKKQVLSIGLADSRYYAKTDKSDSIYEVDPQRILPFISVDSLHYRLKTLAQIPSSSQIIGLRLTRIKQGTSLLDESIADENLSWADHLANRKDIHREAILSLINLLNFFEVEQYIEDHYTPFEFRDQHLKRSWVYELEVNVRLPSLGNQKTIQTLDYTFTEMLNRTTLYGGSPEYDVTFLCKQELMDALMVFSRQNLPSNTNSKK